MPAARHGFALDVWHPVHVNHAAGSPGFVREWLELTVQASLKPASALTETIPVESKAAKSTSRTLRKSRLVRWMEVGLHFEQGGRQAGSGHEVITDHAPHWASSCKALPITRLILLLLSCL